MATSPGVPAAAVQRRRPQQALVVIVVLVLLATTLFYGDIVLVQRSTQSVHPQMLIQPQEAEPQDARPSRAMAVSANQEETRTASSAKEALERELVRQARSTLAEATKHMQSILTTPTPTTTQSAPPPAASPTTMPPTPSLTPAATTTPSTPALTPAHSPTVLSLAQAPTSFLAESPKSTPAQTFPSVVSTPLPPAWTVWPTPTPTTPRLSVDAAAALALYNNYIDAVSSLALPTPSISPIHTPAPTPAPTQDPWFANVELFPANASTHNEAFVTRSPGFDHTVVRDTGILLCLHDKALALGLTLVKELRCLGNHELIQVYHCLPHDLSETNKQLLVSQDNRLEVIDVCGDLINAKVFTEKQAKQFKNWWIKPLAMHHTDLNEPILLDADDILLQNPAIIRESEGYQQNGTLFFYDRVIDERNYFSKKLYGRGYSQILRYIIDNFDYAAFGLSGVQPSDQLLASMAYQDKTCHEMDSSMVAIDKSRAGKAMDVLWWLSTSLRHSVEFSWGDKESFWLAFELAHQSYAFSPWGVSVVSSSGSKDMKNHPSTLCGSIAQYLPSPLTEPAQLLYVNGKALLDPLSHGVENSRAKANIMYNANVTHVVPRMPRTPRQLIDPTTQRSVYAFPQECLVGLGSTPLPRDFQRLLFRRRLHYLAASSAVPVLGPLAMCEFQWKP